MTDAVIVWAPTLNELVDTLAPDPMNPSRSDDHDRLALMLPSSVSMAVATNVTDWPLVTLAPPGGEVMLTVGGWLRRVETNVVELEEADPGGWLRDVPYELETHAQAGEGTQVDQPWRVVPDPIGRVVGVFFNGQVRSNENHLVEECRSASGRLDFHVERAVLGGAEPEQLPCRPVIELERRGARRQRDVLIELTPVDELVRTARRRVVAVEIVQHGPHSVRGLAREVVEDVGKRDESRRRVLDARGTHADREIGIRRWNELVYRPARQISGFEAAVDDRIERIRHDDRQVVCRDAVVILRALAQLIRAIDQQADIVVAWQGGARDIDRSVTATGPPGQ